MAEFLAANIQTFYPSRECCQQNRFTTAQCHLLGHISQMDSKGRGVQS